MQGDIHQIHVIGRVFLEGTTKDTHELTPHSHNSKIDLDFI